MNEKVKKIVFLTVCSAVLLLSRNPLVSQGSADMERQARAHLVNKEFGKAIELFLSILDADPENEKVQKDIESIYLLKQQKDLAMQKAKINYKISRRLLSINQKTEDLSASESEKNFKEIESRSRVAIESFITAYRIEPRDPEFVDMKENMRLLESEVEAEKEKERQSRAIKERNMRLRALARKLMDQENYEKALEHWNEILSFLPSEKVAQEGKRTCTLAIENRLKFEKIRSFIAGGKKLYGEQKYREARLVFLDVINLDSRNGDARDFIEQIDEKLGEIRNRALIEQQAEEAYASGINNLRKNLFNQAKEDFENALALIRNYKDARERLGSIDKLRKEFEDKTRVERLETINREFQNGLIALSEGKYKESVTAFEKTLSLDPGNDLVKNYISKAKDALQLIEEERVDKNSPYYEIVESLIIAGRKLYENGSFKESRSKWEKILTLFPKNKIATEFTMRIDLKLNPEAYRVFAQRYIQEGEELLKKREFTAALGKFEMIKSIKSDHPGIDGLITRANAGLKSFGPTAVFSTRKNTALTDTDIAEINNSYAQGLRLYEAGGRQNLERALALFNAVLARDRDNIRAVISVNKIQSQLRIGAGPVEIGRVRLTPEQQNRVRELYYRGISFYTNNEFDRAVGEWRKVLEIDPTHVQARNNITKVRGLQR